MEDDHVDYSSPRAKGRQFLADWFLWRSVAGGANEAATFVTTADRWLAGTHVLPAVTLFSRSPTRTNDVGYQQETGEWGTAYPGPSKIWRESI